MSSSDSPPPQQQRVSEAESDEELSEGGETGGEMQVEEEPSVSSGETVASHITLHHTQNRFSYMTKHRKYMPTLLRICFLYFRLLLLLLLLLPLKVLPDTPRVGGLVAAVGHQLHSVLPQEMTMTTST
ncbi:uncharacterized protein LOC143765626 [Ranitomeya variabilis]|uniref:uncharacterized protein LOC143765626 n=1 Tax=Ranitomeya variabilis TaxID=490064 RepID=UPI0040565E13